MLAVSGVRMFLSFRRVTNTHTERPPGARSWHGSGCGVGGSYLIYLSYLYLGGSRVCILFHSATFNIMNPHKQRIRNATLLDGVEVPRASTS